MCVGGGAVVRCALKLCTLHGGTHGMGACWGMGVTKARSRLTQTQASQPEGSKEVRACTMACCMHAGGAGSKAVQQGGCSAASTGEGKAGSNACTGGTFSAHTAAMGHLPLAPLTIGNSVPSARVMMGLVASAAAPACANCRPLCGCGKGVGRVASVVIVPGESGCGTTIHVVVCGGVRLRLRQHCWRAPCTCAYCRRPTLRSQVGRGGCGHAPGALRTHGHFWDHGPSRKSHACGQP